MKTGKCSGDVTTNNILGMRIIVEEPRSSESEVAGNAKLLQMDESDWQSWHTETESQGHNCNEVKIQEHAVPLLVLPNSALTPSSH